MKSALFSERNLLSNKGFVNDVEIFVGLGKKVWDSLLERVLDFFSASNDVEEERLVEQTSEESGASPHLVRTAFRVSEFFLSQFLSIGDAKNDSPSDVVDDLQQSLKFDNAITEPLICYLHELKERANTKGEIISAKRFTAKSCLPSLVSMSTALDYRIVFKNPYIDDTAVDSYIPEFYGAVPLGIIELNFGEDEEVKKIAFQADEKAIQTMIANLGALLKQVTVTRTFFKFEGDIE